MSTRTGEVVLAHMPHRPDWDCGNCGEPWPCAPAKVQLAEEHKDCPTRLSIYMSNQMGEALEEAVHNHDWGKVDDLFERFVGWVKGDDDAA